ncbi:MAG TPA: glycosyltransferase family 39 protein [Anaerolineales bacterium]|nr:glycosyltransferase family 39 protein [Anaerolineales bacterium]
MSSLYSSEDRKLQAAQASSSGLLERWLTLIDAYPFRILALIVVLGIVVSLALNMESLPPAPNAGENDSWWTIAQNLAHGQGYRLCLPRYFPFCDPNNQITAAREPLPVLLFAVVAFLSGGSLWAATVVEWSLYLTILVVIYFLTREWLNTRAALLAALLWAVYIPAIELIPQVSGDLLAALLVSLGILFVLRARRTGRIRDWVLAGTSLGLAVVSRSGTLVVAAILIAGVLLEGWRQRVRLQEIVIRGLIFSGLVVLFLGPWLIRNEMAFGRPVLGSSLVGYNLYRHNYMLGTGSYFHYVGGEEGLKAILALVGRRTDLSGTENEAQMDAVYRGEALAIIRAHPVQYVLLSAYRFLPLWFNWGYFEAYGARIGREDQFIMVFQAVLLIFALIGLRGDLRRTWPLWGSVLAISLIYMAVDSQLLYLMPIVPLVISLSAAGANKLLGKLVPSPAHISLRAE